jgi:hypothetical protein
MYEIKIKFPAQFDIRGPDPTPTYEVLVQHNSIRDDMRVTCMVVD